MYFGAHGVIGTKEGIQRIFSKTFPLSNFQITNTMKTIVLIEDNLEIRENTSEILELEGFRVITASNGRIGFELVTTHKPDIILCDIMMPEMNGYEVFEHLKLDDETSAIPFIFITASAEKSEVQKGLNMGAAGYVRKPFTERELLEAINDCLDAKTL